MKMINIKMINIKMINIKNWIFDKFKKKEPMNLSLGKVAIIVSTDVALRNGIDNKFNKNIIMYESVEAQDNKIIWGKIIKEIPYTEEEARNIVKVLEIPLAVRKYSNKIEFIQGSEFAEVVN